MRHGAAARRQRMRQGAGRGERDDMIKLQITENDDRQRLDRFLRKYFKNAPLSRIYKMIRKDVKLNGKRAGEDTMLCAGDELTVYISEEEAESLCRSRRPAGVKKQFRIAYEDENIIVVEKPFGLLVHGDEREKKNTLANQVVDYLIEKGDYVPRRERTFVPSPVNRLDRNTTGLVLFGKNSRTLQSLNRMMREKGYVEKYYLTIVSGRLQKPLTLSDYLTKDHDKNIVKVWRDKDPSGNEGKAIETIARPVAWAKGFTLVEVELVTGRTHQIRAHMQKAGYPVIGDEKYGDPAVNARIRREYGLSTQFLHAYRLAFSSALPPLEYLAGKTVTAPLTDFMETIRAGIFQGDFDEMMNRTGIDRR